MKRVIFLFLSLNILFQLCLTNDTQEFVSKNIATIRSIFPRWTFSFKSIPAKFDPENPEYWQSIAFASLFGCIVALIFVFLSSCFHPIRQLGFCGGFEPMDGFCRGIPRKKVFFLTLKTDYEKPYPKWMTLFAKVFIAILLLIVMYVLL